MRHLLAMLIFLNIASCHHTNTIVDPTTSFTNLTKGIWRGVLNIGSVEAPLEIPFNFEVLSNEKIVIHNGEEHIEVTDIELDSNYVSIKMPVFGSEFKLTSKNNEWEGAWHNYNKQDYSIPFHAVFNNNQRFKGVDNQKVTGLAKRWQVTFSPDTEDSYPAIGLFEVQESGRTTGTFLTETGDYRYLEGFFDGQKLQLSCFDGAHAFLFHADLQADGSLKGDFWSGNHWHEPWQAKPSEQFELRAMEKLTFLKDGYDKFSFKFPDVNGKMVSLEDELFKNKAVIVQITGSWCPNCMDETRFLVDVYNKYHNKGLEIIAIDFEAINDFEVFKKNEERLREHLGLNFSMVFGGSAKKNDAAQTLPMLNHIMSYPTTIFIDKTNKVREIHTGFSGPGTGALYQAYTEKTMKLVETLVSE